MFSGALAGASALSTPALIRLAVICCILFMRSTAAAADKVTETAKAATDAASKPEAKADDKPAKK